MDEDMKYLECGCLILNGRVWRYCDYHFINQPTDDDPLGRFLKERDYKGLFDNEDSNSDDE